VEGSGIQSTQSDTAAPNESNQMLPNTGFGMTPGMAPSMGWGGQDLGAMSQFMPAAMGNFQNPMGTSAFPLVHTRTYIC
jgi:hypothetical protein